MRRQNLILGSLLTLYFFLWSTLPTLLAPSFPLDVIEGINWGREWQLGYYKHPPLALMAIGSIFSNIGSYRPLFAQSVVHHRYVGHGLSIGTTHCFATKGFNRQFVTDGGVLLHLADIGV